MTVMLMVPTYSYLRLISAEPIAAAPLPAKAISIAMEMLMALTLLFLSPILFGQIVCWFLKPES